MAKSATCQALIVIRSEVFILYVFFQHVIHKVITGGFVHQLPWHVSICQVSGGTLQYQRAKIEREERLSGDASCSDVYSGVQEKGDEPIENMSNGIQSFCSKAICQERTRA